MNRSTVALFSGTTGYNNRVQPQRQAFKIDSGVSSLQDTDNVVVSPTGEIVGRLADKQVKTGNFHSLFSVGEYGVIAENRNGDCALYRITISSTGEVTLQGIRSSLSKRPFDFVLVDSKIYYTNGDNNGVIIGNGTASIPWPVQRKHSGSLVSYTSVPAAEHIALLAGRMYFSIGRVLRYSEFGKLGLYDASRNGEHFENGIFCLIPVIDGLYIGTENDVWFMSGKNPHKAKWDRVLPYGVLEFGVSQKAMSSSFLGLESAIEVPIVATVKGPCACLPSGRIENLIESNVSISLSTKAGACAIFDGSLVIQTGE